VLTLYQIAGLARALLAADRSVEQADLALRKEKEKRRIIREETLPGAMQELGIEKLTLETGDTITISREVYASIPAGARANAHRWLQEHNFGGLLKTEVTVAYGRDSAAEASELAIELEQRGLSVMAIEKVHPQTLKAWLKEQLQAGTEIPLDLFGARPVWTAKIKTK